MNRSKWIRSTWFVADYVHFCADYGHADGDEVDDEENDNHANIRLVADDDGGGCGDDYEDVDAQNRCMALTEHCYDCCKCVGYSSHVCE